jgi:DNA-directed RNA polymerase specialized sigma24 family protein
MTKILVVDDDPFIVEGLVELLRIESFDATGALDRETAEKAMASEFYPIVLADLRLRSEAEGWLLLEAIARISPKSRIASMTGYATDDIERELLARGAALVLRKPMEISAIVALMREMVVELEAATGDDLDEVYRQSFASLTAMARRRYGLGADDAQDVLQEAWCLFLSKRASVRTPKAWLSGTVVNLCRRWIEDRVRWRGPDIESFDRGDGGNMDATLVARQALGRVDARTRQLCQLIAVEGLRYDEVSNAMQIPIGSVGPLYMRAKKKMRDVML